MKTFWRSTVRIAKECNKKMLDRFKKQSFPHKEKRNPGSDFPATGKRKVPRAGARICHGADIDIGAETPKKLKCRYSLYVLN